MVNNDIVLKRDSLKNKLGIAGIAVAVILAGVFYMFLIQSVVGILAAGIAGALGLILVQLAPVFAQMVANAKYRLADAEKVRHVQKVAHAAAENPIETLTNQLIAKQAAFREFEDNVTNSAAARDTFKTKLDKFATAYPHRAEEFRKQYIRTEQLVEKKKRALKDAQQSLRDGELKLEEMKAYWEMSKDVIELNRVAGMDTGDVYEKLKADTACDAVFESMNRAFAELEVAAALDVSDRNEVPMLEQSNGSGLSINVTATEEVSTK